MTPHYRIANAPCSWGVDFADRPENPDWRRVMNEAAAAGYTAIDLGPVGYFPTDPGGLSGPPSFPNGGADRAMAGQQPSDRKCKTCDAS